MEIYYIKVNFIQERKLLLFNEFAYKEIDYAKFIIKNGFKTENIKYECSILAKYYKSIGLNKSEARSKIIDICNRSIKEFYYEMYYPLIESGINSGFKKDIIQIDEIKFYKEELDYINNIDVNYSNKKLLFGLLLTKKLNQAVSSSEKLGFVFNGNKRNYANLKRFSGLKNRTQKQINYMFADLIDLELISIRDDDRKYLLFMEHIQDSKELVFTVSNFETAILLFDSYNDKYKVKECEVCGEVFKIESNRHIYCKKCQKQKELQKYNQYNKKRFLPPLERDF